MKKEIKQRYVVVDCETGGLNCLLNPITEIAVVALDRVTLEEVERWETLVKPYAGMVIENGILEKTGISFQELNAKGRVIDSSVSTLIKFFEMVTPKGDRGKNLPLLVGHNVGFDIRFISQMFGLANKQLFDYVSSSTESIEGKMPREGRINCWDTLLMSREYWQDEGLFSLGDCCRRIGYDHLTGHRAMPDVKATIKLFTYLIDKFKLSNVKGKKEAVVEDEMSKIHELIVAFEF